MAVVKVAVSQPWNEQEAEVFVELTAPASVAVACSLVGDDEEVHLAEGAVEQSTHTVRFAGLLEDSEYDCVAATVCPESTSPPVSFQIVTDALSNNKLPAMEVTLHKDRAGQDYMLTNHQVDPWNGQRRLVLDRDGNVRWHALESAGSSLGGSAVSYNSERQSFTIGGGWPPTNSGRAVEIDMFGSGTLYDTRDVLPNYASRLFHHDGKMLADGRMITLEEPVIDNTSGGTFRGFGVTVVNPETDKIEFEWDAQAAHNAGHLPGGNGDVYHANWVDIVDQGGQDVLYASLCNSDQIVAVDVPSGDWRWSFGPGGDFDLVDNTGASLPNSEYPQCQHGLQVKGNRLLVYDNGHNRGFTRVVEYELDETKMEATRVWTWTESNWFERSVGGVDWTTGDRVLISMGHLKNGPSPGDRTTFVEVDPSNDEKLWELKYTDESSFAFRALAIAPCDIFANAKYCPVTRARLDTLSDLLTTTTAKKK